MTTEIAVQCSMLVSKPRGGRSASILELCNIGVLKCESNCEIAEVRWGLCVGPPPLQLLSGIAVAPRCVA